MARELPPPSQAGKVLRTLSPIPARSGAGSPARHRGGQPLSQTTGSGSALQPPASGAAGPRAGAASRCAPLAPRPSLPRVKGRPREPAVAEREPAAGTTRRLGNGTAYMVHL